MNRDIKEKFPSWCDDLDTIYTLCLSNDLDSLMSCIFLREIKGYSISHFYTFSALGKIQGHKHTQGNLIGVDIDLTHTNGKTWGNHVTMLSKKDNFNNNCANLNVINRISRENYTSKYCGSTVLQILSYYNYDISKFSEEALMILMCIDSSYLPFYTSFKSTGTYYMKEVLEFPELVELTKRHTQEEFEQLNKKYNLKAPIQVKKGYLHTDIDLAGLSKVFLMPIELPLDGFELLVEFIEHKKSIPRGYYNVVKPDDAFSLAVTFTNYYKYSTVKKKGELVC